MNEQFNQRVLQIAEAIEHIWLRYEGAYLLLKEVGVPNSYDLVMRYTEEETNKARAHQRFAEVTALLQKCLLDSTALESLSEALRQVKPN
jgi:hypothetical protein